MSNKKWLLMCFLALGTAFLLYITYTPTTRKWEKVVVVEKEPGMYSVMEVPKKNPVEEGQHNDPVHNKTGNNPTKDVPSKNPDEEGQHNDPVHNKTGNNPTKDVPSKNPDEEGQHNDPVHNKTGNNPIKDVPSKNPDEEGQHNDPVHNKTGNNPTKDVPSKNPDEEGQHNDPVHNKTGNNPTKDVPSKNPDEEGQHNDPVHNKTGNNPIKDGPSKNPVQKEPELHPDEEGQSRNPVEEEPDMYHVAYPRKYKFILDQPQKCQQQNPFVVVIVPVPPQSVEERNAIRTTWGGEKSFDNKVVLVLFLLGSHSEAGQETLQDQLQNESQQYQDLIQSNFQDSYRNLTIKTMVMMEWLSRNCPQASYAVKVDADVLLNIKNLINMLVSLNTVQNNYMSGLVWFESPVMRDPFNKFYLPYDVYPKEKYPPYPLGMCYIFSMDIPHKLLQESKQIKPIYIEDAYLGMCLERLGIVPSKPPNIDQFVVKPPQQYNRCYYSSLIAIMTDSTNQLITYWTDIHSTSTPC
ncbi:beta-1,3-galactosyltransferase 1-like [Xyrauchen texanus]|uniref:beta-1,3-galactosyltransferase 1-like n=1 Tax=Xyrauchen texanus TaxID=154827 RepID=UPI0022428649|nr:beta-1,3-galactosyltransferase 1-like [Xyrauchen texanus]